MPTSSTPPTAPPPAEGLLHGLSFQQLLLLACQLREALFQLKALLQATQLLTA